MATGLLSLKWNNHRTTLFHVLSTIRSKDSYCDVTLACDGRFYSLHKFVLAMCSEYFEQIFQKTECKHPVIVLKDIGYEDLEALLNYMYIGEVNVVQEKLSGLIKAAECLKIKGLAVPDEEEAPPTKESTTRGQQQITQKRSQRSDDSPRAKRRRRNVSSDGPTEEASDQDRSFDLGRNQQSNQQFNSQYKRLSSHNNNDDDRGHGHGNSHEYSASSPSIMSPRNSRDSNDCQSVVEQVDPIAEVKTEPLESEVVSVSPEIRMTLDSKDGLLGGLEEGGAGHAMDSSFEGLQVEGSPSNYPHDSMWKAEEGCSYEVLEDTNDSSVHTSTQSEGRRPSISLEGGSYQVRTATLPGVRRPSISYEDGGHHQFPQTSSGMWNHDSTSRAASSSPSTNPAITSSSFLSNCNESSYPLPSTQSYPSAVCGDGGKEFKCPKCPYSTDFGHNLKMHLRTHTGVRPFACSLCDYRATQKVHVERHMRRHTGVKPFVCPHCNYRSNRKDHLKDHIIATHDMEYRTSQLNASQPNNSSLVVPQEQELCSTDHTLQK